MTINDLLYTDTSLFLWSENVLAWPFRGPLYSDAGIKSEKLQSGRKFVVHLYQKLLQSYVILRLRAWGH